MSSFLPILKGWLSEVVGPAGLLLPGHVLPSREVNFPPYCVLTATVHVMLYHCTVNEREEPEDQAGDVTLTALDAIGFKRIRQPETACSQQPLLPHQQSSAFFANEQTSVFSIE